ncbi:MAG: 50S ribosomal protein L30 [Thermodesulfobacteriota bacterium]|nr:50S ribosomal protein L30 [Thermodesulfobacteriota bacterium]
MQEVKLKLVKSKIGRPKKHKLILKSLGLKKMNKVKTLRNTPQIEGMINKVSHLIEIID